uniref:CHHC U11-48K-type domain-containing protein n=1 Tax=Periophthalmus magnuspinnatus TaxID=409849 RepID=A0A3B4BH19_9GOBI
MNTITFGTTTEPLHIATAGRDQPAEEFDDKGNIDPDRLLQCPFDKNHQIRACRFPYHLIKCRKNHPKLASELKTCPYNARHLVPKHELNHHTETCEDRITVDIMDAEAVHFVWGENTGVNARQEMRPTNNLGPTCRIPNTLPWPSFNP